MNVFVLYQVEAHMRAYPSNLAALAQIVARRECRFAASWGNSVVVVCITSK